MIAPRRTILVLAAALAVTGGASLAQGPDPEPAETGPAGTQPPIAAVEAEQAARYGVFRRQQTASDRLGDQAVRFFQRGMTREQGAAPGLARRAQVTAGNAAVYVVPGRGSVCLYSEDLATRDAGGTCNGTSAALRGYIQLLEWPAPAITRVVGMVPDGVHEVTLRGDEGAIERVAAVDNTYVFETGLTPRLIEWGDVSLPIPKGLGD